MASLEMRAVIKRGLQASEFSKEVGGLRSETSIASFFDSVSAIAKKTYFQSQEPEILKFRTGIEGQLKPTLVERAVKNQDFGETDPNSTDYDNLLATTSFEKQIERTMIRDIILEDKNKLGLSNAERIVLLGHCDLGDQFDDLYRNWRGKVVGNGLLDELKQNPKAKDELMKKVGLKDKADAFLYSVLEGDINDIKVISYAEAFPEQIEQTGKTLSLMVEELRKLEDAESIALADYYEAFGKAITSPTPTDHEELWKQVDKKWMKVSGRMQPIHPMEAYVDPNGLIVEPDLALTFRDNRDEAASINDLTEVTKQNMIGHLTDEYGDKKSLQTSIDPMQASIAGVFVSQLAGRRLDFRPAGQNIPNRSDVRINDGVKIFLDSETMHQRWLIQREILTRVFGEDFVKEQFDTEHDLIKFAAGIHVAGHEVAHNAFVQEDTRDSIGADQYAQIEEHKADTTILATAPSWLNLDERRTFLKAIFAGEVRSLALKTDESRKPYYNSAVFIINQMLDAGIVYKDEGGWHYDDSQEKLGSFFERVKLIYARELVPVYDERNPAKAADYIIRNFKPSEVLAQFEESIFKK